MCQETCYDVLQAQPSEAIRARSHMYLSMEGVGPDYASGRAYHAGMAIEAWEAVINRTGASRFPIEKARKELELAKQLLEIANAAVELEEEPEVIT